MSRREIPRRRRRKVAIGDMRDKVGFYERAVTPPAFDSTEPTETYTLVATRWTQVETFNPFGPFQGGERLINQVAPTDVVTHFMKIRFIETLTKEHRLKWKGEIYTIDKLVNPEERDEYLEVYAAKLGTDSKGANQ